MTINMTGLSEQPLGTLLTAGWTVAGYFLWRMLTRIEKKQDSICAVQASCQRELPEKYVLAVKYDSDQFGPTGVWEAINHLRSKVER